MHLYIFYEQKVLKQIKKKKHQNDMKCNTSQYACVGKNRKGDFQKRIKA